MPCSHRSFTLTWSLSVHTYLNKRKCLHKKEFNTNRIDLKHQHDRRFIVLGYVETNTDIFETTLLHKSAFRSHSEAKGGWTRSEMHLGRTNQPITLPNLVAAYFT